MQNQSYKFSEEVLSKVHVSPDTVTVKALELNLWRTMDQYDSSNWIYKWSIKAGLNIIHIKQQEDSNTLVHPS